MSHLKVVALAILLVLLGKHQRRRRIRELVFESLGRARSRDDDLLRLLQHATIPRGRTAALSSNGLSPFGGTGALLVIERSSEESLRNNCGALL
jgi:hypothetical protein